ncbi:phosphoglyceromutase [Pseudonocardia yunnanensis]|uniref:2,3-bisphosphoglycerate-dependent phosphoglycerate mutase n=1 Tax=Pseudonocardia yunnanensis TaxID=58107 RepID=A0ABW4EWS0_9PSEU
MRAIRPRPGGGAHTLLLLRHGQSAANSEDSFSGWLDVPLSDRGRREAARAGELMKEQAVLPDVVHTSVLTRAIHTADIALASIGHPWLPTRRSWRLNERHYGALQGRSRTAVRAEFGDERYSLWRRSYEHAPPPLPEDDPSSARHDGRYADVPVRELPTTEALSDVYRRVVPYWQDAIAADLYAGRVVLVVAHSNSLRALCMHLDALTPREVETLNIPTGVPLHYELDHEYRPHVRGGTYLDPQSAAAGIAEVLAQGTRRPPERGSA